MLKKIKKASAKVAPHYFILLFSIIICLGIYKVWGGQGESSYWLTGVLFVMGSLLSIRVAATSSTNTILQDLREMIVGSAGIGLKSIKRLEDNPPEGLAVNTKSKFLFVGVAGSKFLKKSMCEGAFFRTNSNIENVKIILMDPFSDDLKKLSKQPGVDAKDRKKIIESIKFLNEMRNDGYKFDVRLYPKIPPLRLMICDGSVTTLSVYTADSSGWQNAQLLFDAAENPNSLAPYFESLFEDLWTRSVSFNLETRVDAFGAIANSEKVTKTIDVGMVHGRFQPFHHEHLEYILCGINRSNMCYIGITQPDIENLSETCGAAHRAQELGNPFSFEQRKMMIEITLHRLGIPDDCYKVIGIDIDNIDSSLKKLNSQAPDKGPVQIMKIFSDWEKYKKSKFIENGYDVVEICESHKEFSSKNITGTLVRELINTKRNWEDYVPIGTSRVVKEKV